MSEWKKVKIDFDTIKLGNFIEPIKTTVLELGDKNPIVYGVTNKEGIVQTGKPASKDISNYIALEDDCFAFNPYRVNVGSIGINDKKLKGCVSPAYIVFKTKNGLLPKFLYFYLKSDYGIHLINWYGNRGGVRNALRYSDLCNIDIPNINHLDQQKILEKFLSVSDKIDEISKEIESQKKYIKQLRQNILQEAIEGKLTAEWRKQNPVQKGNPDYDAEALFEQIQKKRINEMKQKELSPITDEEKPFEIPEGWKWVRLGEISYNRSTGPFGSMLHKSDYVENGIPLINPTNIKLNHIDYSSCMTISQKKYNELSHYALSRNDIILARRGDLSKCGIIHTSELQICGTGCFFMKLHNINLFFFKLVYQSQKSQDYLLQDSIGQTMDNLNQKLLEKLPFPLPPLKEQEEIVTKVESLLAKVTELENQIQERKTLSEKLIFGIIKEVFEEKKA